MSKTITTQQGDTLDLICWRHYGRSAGAVEPVLKANPGLAAKGLVLPFGTSILLPELTFTDAVKTVSLWD